MIRVGVWLVLSAGVVFWCLLAKQATMGALTATIALATGSFSTVLILVISLALVFGTPSRAIVAALAAGLTATAVSGPLLGLLSPSAAYSVATGIALVLLSGVTKHQLAPVVATTAQLWSLITLARLQLGFGGSLIEAKPSLFAPAVAVGLVTTLVYVAAKCRLSRAPS